MNIVTLDLNPDERDLLFNVLDTCIDEGYGTNGLDTAALERLRDVLQVQPTQFSCLDSEIWRAVAALEHVRDDLTPDTEESTIAELTGLADRITAAREDARQSPSPA